MLLRLPIIFSLTLCFYQLYSQSGTSGGEWYYSIKFQGSYDDQGYSHAYYDGDTVVTGIKAEIIQRDFYGIDTSIFYKTRDVFLRTDSIVYRLIPDPIKDTFAQVFDYRVPVGSYFWSYSTWRVPDKKDITGFLIRIDRIDTIYSLSKPFKRFTYSAFGVEPIQNDTILYDTALTYYFNLGGHHGLRPQLVYDSTFTLGNESNLPYLRCYSGSEVNFVNPFSFGQWNDSKNCNFFYIDKYLSQIRRFDLEKDKHKHKIFPNPTNQSLTIQSSLKGHFKLIDGSGSLVRSGQVDGQAQVNVAEFPRGVYFLQIESKDGSGFRKEILQ